MIRDRSERKAKQQQQNIIITHITSRSENPIHFRAPQRVVNLCLTVFISNKFVNHFFAPFISFYCRSTRATLFGPKIVSFCLRRLARRSSLRLKSASCCFLDVSIHHASVVRVYREGERFESTNGAHWSSVLFRIIRFGSDGISPRSCVHGATERTEKRRKLRLHS